MLEFIFFDDRLQKQFADHLNQEQISFSLPEDPMGHLLVEVDLPEDDPRSDALEDFNDSLMEQQEQLLQQEDAEGSRSLTAITVHLQDDTTVYANVEAELMNRLLTVASPEEISILVDSIATAIENHDTRPLCKR